MATILERIDRLSEAQRALLRLRLGGTERATAGESRLVGYIVPRGERRDLAPDLREFLRERLPDYMVPGAWIVIDSFPMTSRGKVDRAALQGMARSAWPAESRGGVPRNDCERAIADIWKEVLGLPVMGLQDNFFDLGGHSLLLPKVLARVRELAQREVSMVDLFRYPTVQALAAYVAGESRPVEEGDSGDHAKGKREAGIRRMTQRRRRQAALRSE